eukprot:TRINITY_DN57765_c0_g1_i1.p1 TRINITY_DN57765_c0_g1~~TRINITY_DN57765_c0_g1_i1.p1  ORF type:complete len:294 (-),score=49.80 TRINITY_DN57765_c0_g1_i1:551-1432(-)
MSSASGGEWSSAGASGSGSTSNAEETDEAGSGSGVQRTPSMRSAASAASVPLPVERGPTRMGSRKQSSSSSSSSSSPSEGGEGASGGSVSVDEARLGDQEYLQEHQVNVLFNRLVVALEIQQPANPLNAMIELLQASDGKPSDNVKPPANGVKYLRKSGVCKIMDECILLLIDKRPTDVPAFLLQHLQTKAGVSPAPKQPDSQNSSPRSAQQSAPESDSSEETSEQESSPHDDQPSDVAATDQGTDASDDEQSTAESLTEAGSSTSGDESGSSAASSDTESSADADSSDSASD